MMRPCCRTSAGPIARFRKAHRRNPVQASKWQASIIAVPASAQATKRNRRMFGERTDHRAGRSGLRRRFAGGGMAPSRWALLRTRPCHRILAAPPLRAMHGADGVAAPNFHTQIPII